MEGREGGMVNLNVLCWNIWGLYDNIATPNTNISSNNKNNINYKSNYQCTYIIVGTKPSLLPKPTRTWVEHGKWTSYVHVTTR